MWDHYIIFILFQIWRRKKKKRVISLRDYDLSPFLGSRYLGQAHVNEWDYVITSQNNDSTNDIVPPKLRVLHLESPLRWQGVRF